MAEVISLCIVDPIVATLFQKIQISPHRAKGGLQVVGDGMGELLQVSVAALYFSCVAFALILRLFALGDVACTQENPLRAIDSEQFRRYENPSLHFLSCPEDGKLGLYTVVTTPRLERVQDSPPDRAIDAERAKSTSLWIVQSVKTAKGIATPKAYHLFDLPISNLGCRSIGLSHPPLPVDEQHRYRGVVINSGKLSMGLAQFLLRPLALDDFLLNSLV
jgi:hypothetical protein